jgi:DNA repair protein RecO (recombination protein O)
MKLTGITLHSIKYGESSLIVYLYTQQQGRQTYMLHGARKPAARQKAAMIQPLFVLDMEIYPPRKNAGMGIIKELKPAIPLAQLAGNVQKTAIALFISEVLYRFIKEEEVNAHLYGFLEQQILHLNNIESGIANFHLFFLAQLARHLGFLPGNDYDDRRHCFFDIRTGCFVDAAPTHLQYMEKSTASLLWQLLQCQIADLKQFTLNQDQRNTLLRGLLEYYSFHLGMQNPIRSQAVLHEVFS